MTEVSWAKNSRVCSSDFFETDVLTDELAQIHRSPGFLSSVLNGVNDDGTIIKVWSVLRMFLFSYVFD
jgi:isocitrate dehydrogenase